MTAALQSELRKPTTYEGFESASRVLWKEILKSEVQRLGRSGQEQWGLDLTGYRDGQPDAFIGIQCKCHNKSITQAKLKKEMKADLDKALKHDPKIMEYYFTTTAENDSAIEKYASQLTEAQRKSGRDIIVRYYGWGNITELVSLHQSAIDAFDPTYSAHSNAVRQEMTNLGAEVRLIKEMLQLNTARTQATAFDYATNAAVPEIDKYVDAEINALRDAINDGKAKATLSSLNSLWDRLPDAVSNHLRFRVKANIGHCHLHLGNTGDAIRLLEEAISYDKTSEKAIANSVLLHLLKEAPKQAVEIAIPELQKYERLESATYETIAYYYFQAAARIEGFGDPWRHIPEQARHSPGADKGFVEYLRHAEKTPEWWLHARDALQRHPEDEYLQKSVAEADLDEIARQAALHSKIVGRDERQRLKTVCTVLGSAWSQIEKSDGVRDDEFVAACANYALALHLSGEDRKAIDVVSAGLKRVPSNDQLLIRKATLCHLVEDRSSLKEIFNDLKNDGEQLVLKCQIAAEDANWAFLASLHTRKSPTTAPASERGQVSTLISAAKILVGKSADKESALKSLAEKVANDARSAIIVAQIARFENFPSLENFSFGAAIRAIKPDSHYADRVTVANYAHRRDAFKTVILMLTGHVVVDVDNYELRILANAFANVNPPRTEAIKFFDSLPVSIRSLPHFQRCEALFAFKMGDLPKAAGILREIMTREPNDVWALLLLAQCKIRGGEELSVETFPFPTNLIALKGRPEELIRLSHVLAIVGKSEDALSLAHSTLFGNPDNAIVNLMYFGLFMARHAPTVPKYESASVGAWVRLATDHGEEWDAIIEENGDIPSRNVYGITGTVGSALAGLKVGDHYEIKGPMGTQSGTVKSLWSKYLYFYNDVSEHFERRFPDHKGIKRLIIKDDDLSEILDLVRQRAESIEYIAKCYDTGILSLAMIGAQSGGDAVTLANTIVASGRSILTCAGSWEERREALNAIRTSEKAVFDLLTVWTLIELDAIDVAKAVFKEIIVPSSVLDQLAAMKPSLGGEARGSLVYHDGKYHMTEYSPDDLEKQNAEVISIEEVIKREFSVSPCTVPLELKDEIETLIEDGNDYVVDPIFCASNENALLLTDDMPLRSLAGLIAKVPSAWLQCLFLHAKAVKAIDEDRYARLVIALAHRRRSYLTIDGHTLAHIAANFEGADFVTCTNLLGGKNADINSHVRVFIEFALNLYRSELDGTEIESRIGQQLEKLLLHRHGDYRIILDYLESLRGRLGIYVRGWRRGHFM